MSSTMNITDLPYECLSHILLLTSPRDVIRSSAVSKQFLSVSESDAVWINFLPSNIDEIVSQSTTPLLLQQFASKKDLYFHLCSNPVLFQAQTQSFALNKWNGKKCYMFGARALKIIWGNTPRYWTWIHLPESRFPETAELLNVCWLLLKTCIYSTILSPNTTYGAYFVYKLCSNHCGFENIPAKVSILEVHDEDESIVAQHLHGMPFNRVYLNPTNVNDLPTARGDGWMEIEMGKYYVSVDKMVMLRMMFEQLDPGNWKSGLLVQGIELRPLD